MKKNVIMVQKHPIKCQHCGKDTGYYSEDFMFMVITNDIECPHCNKIIISADTKIISSDIKISNMNIDDIIFPTMYNKSSGIFVVDYPHKSK